MLNYRRVIIPKGIIFGGYTTIVWVYTTIYWDTANFWDIIWDIQPLFSSMKNMNQYDTNTDIWGY